MRHKPGAHKVRQITILSYSPVIQIKCIYLDIAMIEKLTISIFEKLNKGPSIKDVRSQVGGEGVCLVWTFCEQGGRGFLQMRTSALFGEKKLRIFRNLWYVRTDKREWGSIFCDFVRKSFMDGL